MATPGAQFPRGPHHLAPRAW